MSVHLRQKRGRILGTLTRARRRAFVIIDSRGSRRQLTSLIAELDEILAKLHEVNDEYVATLENEEQKLQASEYVQEAETQHQDAINRIERHLSERHHEPPSVSSSASKSAVSKAEIKVKVKCLETVQLERRLAQEREAQELEWKRRLQEAQDAQEAAELRARLTKEDDLNWERRHDFDGEPVDQVEPSANPDVRPSNQGEPHLHLAHPSQEQSSAVRISAEPQSTFLHQRLQRLSLPKFSGDAGEWPRWSALFKTMVDSQSVLSDTEKMVHLQASVVGMAQRTISGKLYDGELYAEAMKTLEDRFGRQEDVVHAHLQDVFLCPAVSHHDPVGLERLQASVHCAVVVFRKLGYEGDLKGFENLRRIIQKLPDELKQAWGEYILDLTERKNVN